MGLGISILKSPNSSVIPTLLFGPGFVSLKLMIRFILLLLLPVSLFAQQSDILLLQKNHRTIRRFFPGSTIDFYTTEHTGVSAVVDHIKNDSLFLLQYQTRMTPNYFGGFTPDTVAVYRVQYSIYNIYSFPVKPKAFGFITNGSLFMLGGGAYLFLNVVNTLRDHDPPFGKDNQPNIVGGAATFITGLLLNKTRRKEYRPGKKYKLKLLPRE